MSAGRPSLYSDDLVTAICQRIAEGESLRAICRDEKMPACSTVFRWLAERTEFQEQYARATSARADMFAEEIIEISDDGSNDYMERKNSDGSSYEVVNTEVINRSRLRVDTRKWLMSKMAPKKYGDKITAEHSGAVTVKIADDDKSLL